MSRRGRAARPRAAHPGMRRPGGTTAGPGGPAGRGAVPVFVGRFAGPTAGPWPRAYAHAHTRTRTRTHTHTLAHQQSHVLSCPGASLPSRPPAAAPETEVVTEHQLARRRVRATIFMESICCVSIAGGGLCSPPSSRDGPACKKKAGPSWDGQAGRARPPKSRRIGRDSGSGCQTPSWAQACAESGSPEGGFALKSRLLGWRRLGHRSHRHTRDWT